MQFRFISLFNLDLRRQPQWLSWFNDLVLHIRLKLKIFYSLNQSVLIHLLSKILAFLAFIAFKGLKRPKKAEKKTFAKWLRIVQFGEKSNKKNFPSQIFFDLCDLGASWSLTLVAFFWEKSGFWGSRKLVLKKARVSTVRCLVRCSLICSPMVQKLDKPNEFFKSTNFRSCKWHSKGSLLSKKHQ